MLLSVLFITVCLLLTCGDEPSADIMALPIVDRLFSQFLFPAVSAIWLRNMVAPTASLSFVAGAWQCVALICVTL